MDTDTKEPYIIGETAYNHQGDIKYLSRMIDDIADIGLDAIKFHMLLDPEDYMQKSHPLLEKVKEWVFTREEWDTIIEDSREKGLDVVILCDDIKSMEYSIHKDVSAVEIHATSINDWFLLKKAAPFPGPIILGVGGSSLEEIVYAVDLLQEQKKSDILLMYGFQSYPTDYCVINLSKMGKLTRMFGLPVGYADHTAYDDPYNDVISVAGAAMGFPILEKHYTLDYGKERIDYHAAVGKEQMIRIKELMKVVLKVYGDGSLRMSEPEQKYGNIGPMKKAIVAKKHIKKGKQLSFQNLTFKRTQKESYIKQRQFLQLIGMEALSDIKEDELIDFEKITYEFTPGGLESFTHVDK